MLPPQQMQQPPMPPQGGQPQRRTTGIQGEMGPEHVEQLKVAWQQVHNILFAQDSRVLTEIIKAVKGGADQVSVVSGAVVTMLNEIEKKIGEIDMALLLPLGLGIMREIRKAFESAGLPVWEAEQRQGIMKQALTSWLRAHPEVDPAEVQQLMQQAQQGGGAAQGLLAQVAGGA